MITDVGIVQSTDWNEKLIDLDDFGVTLSSVTSLIIGMNATAANNFVYFDDFVLYPSRCLSSPGVSDLSGDCTVEFKDFAIMANKWYNTGMWP